MKSLQKLFAVMCLMTIVGLVGCADATKTPDETKKTPTGDKTHADHDHDHDDAGKTPDKTEPAKTPTDVPTPAENPDVQKEESGSVEKKGGPEIPNE